MYKLIYNCSSFYIYKKVQFLKMQIILHALIFTVKESYTAALCVHHSILKIWYIIINNNRTHMFVNYLKNIIVCASVINKFYVNSYTREQNEDPWAARSRAFFTPSGLLPPTCNSITWHICTFVSNRGVSGRGLFCWPMMLFRFVIVARLHDVYAHTLHCISMDARGSFAAAYGRVSYYETFVIIRAVIVP